MAAVAGLPGMPELLRYILVRDPSRRPSLADVAHRRAHPPALTLLRCPLPRCWVTGIPQPHFLETPSYQR